MKKLLAIVMVAAMTLSMCVMANAADDPGYSASWKKSADGEITVTISATNAEKMDVGIVYDPTVYDASVSPVAAFRELGTKLNEDEEPLYIGSNVTNKAAPLGDTTYAMFTCAWSQATPEGEPFVYAGEVVNFKFKLKEGKTSADATELIVVTDTASKDDAEALVATPLKTYAAADVKAKFDEPDATKAPDPTNPDDPGNTTPDNNDQDGNKTPDTNNQDGNKTPDTNNQDGNKTPDNTGKTPAAQTADVAPVATMVTLVLMAGAVLVVLKKRAAE